VSGAAGDSGLPESDGSRQSVAASAHKDMNSPRRGLLIWLSGADPDTLSRSPREKRKYSGLAASC